MWKSRKGTDSYEKFVNVIRDSNGCSVNRDCSAGTRKANSVVECFSTSVEKYNLQYTEYLGDDDSKSCKEVCEADPYGKPIKKLSIGHIQKRVGRKLRTLKDDGYGKKKKKKPQRLHFTDKNINKLQNYYVIAVRACTGRTIQEMKRDIAAALYHCCEFNTMSNVICFVQKQRCLGVNTRLKQTDKYKTGIHNKLFRLVKPVFIELSDDELLKKCLHGKTENTNESVSGVIWKDVRKTYIWKDVRKTYMLERCPQDIYLESIFGKMSARHIFGKMSARHIFGKMSARHIFGKMSARHIFGKMSARHICWALYTGNVISFNFVAKRTYPESRKVVRKKAIRVKQHVSD